MGISPEFWAELDSEEERAKFFAELDRKFGGKTGSSAVQTGKWAQLTQPQPEGGGPFGGRDNALTSFVGILRAKAIPFDLALFFAHQWNRQFCVPPLEDAVVDEKVRRWWVEWQEGGHEDDTPDAAKTIRALSMRELLAVRKDPERALKWVAKDLIQKDGITIISAPPKAGKTWLALDFCRHLSRPEGEETGDWLGKYALPRMRCLYLDAENGEPMLSERCHALGFTEEWGEITTVSYPGLKLDRKDDRGRLKGLCRDKGAELVVFDSLKAFHSQDENSATAMRGVGDFLQEFTQAGLCVVALHHDKKGGGEFDSEQDKTRGSGDIIAFSQTVLGLTKSHGTYYLRQRAVRGAEQDETPIRFKIVHDGDPDDPDRRVLKPLGVEDGNGMSPEEIASQVLEILQSSADPVKTKTITENIPARRENVLKALKRLETEGLIDKAKDGAGHVYSPVFGS